jgi:hypothetical protein
MVRSRESRSSHDRKGPRFVCLCPSFLLALQAALVASAQEALASLAAASHRENSRHIDSAAKPRMRNTFLEDSPSTGTVDRKPYMVS